MGVRLTYRCAGSGLWGKPDHSTPADEVGDVETVDGATKVWCPACATYRADLGRRYEEREARLQEGLCHPGRVDFVAIFGAPGHGQSWKCKECAGEWVRIGESFIDPATTPADEEPPWILTEADVR